MKKNVIRLLFALVALLTSTSMLAENALRIASEGDGKFAILMDCDENAAGMQFNLQLPDALTIKEVEVEGRKQYIYRNPERFNNGQQIRSNIVNGNKHNVLCMIVSMQGESFRGEQGTPVAYFETEKKIETSTWENKDLKLTDIIFSSANGTQLPAAEESVYDGAVYGVVNAYFDLDNIVVNPDSRIQVPIALNNTFDVSGLQMDIVLPDGFTMEETEFEHSARVSTTAQIKSTNKGNTYALVMTDIITNESITKGDGLIFYCFVNAPSKDVFNSNAVFTINNVGASNIEGKFVKGFGSSLNVTNGILAQNSAYEVIAGLRSDLAAALAEIAESCPDVKDNEEFSGADITAAINNLEEAVKGAYEDLTLTPNYDEVMAPVATIKSDIEKLVADAKAAQTVVTDRLTANIEAHDADIAELDRLQNLLKDEVDVIDAEYGDFKDEAAIAAVQKMIDDARATADADFNEAQANKGTYVSKLDAPSINTAIMDLVAAAAAAKAEAEKEATRKEDNLIAYNKSLDELKGVQDHYNEVVAQIQKDYAEFEDVEAEKNVQDAIDDAKAEAKAAFDAVAEKDTYNYKVDVDGLNAKIDDLLTAAQEAAKKAEDDKEADRLAKNKAAYEADLAALDGLYELYREVVDEIQSKYAAYENVSAELKVRNNLDAAKTDVEKAYKAVEKEGYYSYGLDAEGLKAQIEKLLADAKAQAEAADEETKRQNENLSAYNKVIATIDALEAQLKVTVAKIQAEFPEFEDEAAENLVKAELEALRAEANKAYLDVEKEGKFEFTVDQEAYEAKINKLYDDAKAKADAVKDEADRQKENLEAYNAAVADIDALQAKLDATVAQIQAEYAEYEDVEAEAAVQGQIDALREEAKKAYDAVAEAGKFDYAVEAAPVEAAIAQLLADAKAKAEAADAEAKRKADNEKAYNDVVASLDELEARYNEVVAEIKDKYAPYEDVEAENAVKETIDAYRDAAASALEAVAEAGNYNFTFDAEGLAAEIENLLEDAKAKSEDREARNKAAYDKVIDELNALRAEKDAAVEKILAEYPDYDPSAESRDIDAAIDALESGAYVAYLAVLVEGEYEFTYDPELIRSMISQMMDNAVGVEAIEAEVVAGNAYIFTLDGKQHQRPVHGEVNVIVRKNGERSKIFVK